MFRALLFQTLLLISSSSLLTAQADLVLTSAGYGLPQVDLGGVQVVVAEVENTGVTASTSSYALLRVADDFSNTEIIVEPTRVAIQPLNPGETQTIELIFSVPSNIPFGDYLTGITLDPYDQVVEIDESNSYCVGDAAAACLPFYVNPAYFSLRKYAQPVVFIHGLASEAATWNPLAGQLQRQYGWTYGGRLDYCLNPDNNPGTSTDSIYAVSEVSDLVNGDFYFINFNSDFFNSAPCGLSNQEAITKQGWAVQQAIAQILEVTGAEQVVLVGHSMGGLASREYLQNSNNWQPDGDAHVAKLLTIATPNGGSNVGISLLGDLFSSADSESSAVRDLRHPSFFYDGQFLFGGSENFSIIPYTNDINCNGVVGDQIAGLNQKSIPSDITYACIFDEDDEVVDADRADLNQYPLPTPPFLGLYADRFEVETSSSISFSDHTNIHKEVDNFPSIVAGLDESSFLLAAQPLSVPSDGFGIFTIPAPNHPDQGIDFDDHQITLDQPGELTITMRTIPVATAAIFLFDTDLNELTGVVSESDDELTLTYTVAPGDYIVDFAGIPTTLSYRYPYYYSVEFEPLQPLVAAFSADTLSGCLPLTVTFSNTSLGQPFTFEWQFEGATQSGTPVPEPTVTFVEAGTHSVTLIVTSPWDADTLFLEDYITIIDTPNPAFSSSTSSAGTILFNNQTVPNGGLIDYLWDFGDGQTATTENPTHTYTTAGAYDVSLTATNTCGSSTWTQVVGVAPTSFTAGFSAASTTGCAPAQIQFTNESASTDTLTYAWLFPGGSPSSSTATNPSITYLSPGSYDVSLQVAAFGDTATLTEIGYLLIDSIPNVDFMLSSIDGRTINLINNSTAPLTTPTYFWNFGDDQTSTDTNPTHTYSTDGIYAITLTAQNDCGSEQYAEIVTIETVSTEQNTDRLNASLAPNPARNELFVNIATKSSESFDFYVVGISGKKIPVAASGSNDLGFYRITIGKLTPGSYQLMIQSRDGRSILPFIKL